MKGVCVLCAERLWKGRKWKEAAEKVCDEWMATDRGEDRVYAGARGVGVGWGQLTLLGWRVNGDENGPVRKSKTEMQIEKKKGEKTGGRGAQ